MGLQLTLAILPPFQRIPTSLCAFESFALENQHVPIPMYKEKNNSVPSNLNGKWHMKEDGGNIEDFQNGDM